MLNRFNRNQVVFECIRLKGSSKLGIIKPDKDGCYTQVIGGLNAYNSGGSFYELEAGLQFFQAQSSFQRKIGRGVLRAETGHPKKTPGMKEYEYGERILRIEETLVCGTWRKIWLSNADLRDEQGRRIVPIMGTIYPSGPYRDMLIHAFQSPGEQVCFSIRSFTNDIPRGDGTFIKKLLQIVTFDYVNEPGIWSAEKLLSPTLESRTDSSLERSYASSVARESSLSPNLEHNSADRALLSETLNKSRAKENALERSLFRDGVKESVLSPNLKSRTDSILVDNPISRQDYSYSSDRYHIDPSTLLSVMDHRPVASMEESRYDSEFKERLLEIVHTETKKPSLSFLDWK
nr:MAG TPA: Prohead core protein protease [Caudoviricetes sp.]